MLRLQQAIESGEARGPDAELQFARLTQENIKRQIFLWTEENKKSGGAYTIQVQKLTRARAENEQLLMRIEGEVYGHGGVNKVAVKQPLPGSRRMIGAPKGQFAEAEGSIDWLIQSVQIWATKSGDRSSLKTIGALFPNVIQSLKGVVSDRTIARMVKLWASVPEGERTGKSQRTLAHEMSKVAFRMRNDLTDAKERAQSGLRLRGGAGGEESKQEEVDDPGEAEFHMRRAQEAKEYFGGRGRIEDSSFQKDIQNVFSGPRGEPFERSKKNLVEWVGKLKQSPHVNQGAVTELVASLEDGKDARRMRAAAKQIRTSIPSPPRQESQSPGFSAWEDSYVQASASPEMRSLSAMRDASSTPKPGDVDGFAVIESEYTDPQEGEKPAIWYITPKETYPENYEAVWGIKARNVVDLYQNYYSQVNYLSTMDAVLNIMGLGNLNQPLPNYIKALLPRKKRDEYGAHTIRNILASRMVQKGAKGYGKAGLKTIDNYNERHAFLLFSKGRPANRPPRSRRGTIAQRIKTVSPIGPLAQWYNAFRKSEEGVDWKDIDLIQLIQYSRSFWARSHCLQ